MYFFWVDKLHAGQRIKRTFHESNLINEHQQMKKNK